jgi:hypothetical protein
MQLTKEVIRKMMRSIYKTHQHEITCGECFSEVDRFAELELMGKKPVEALPLVQEHLDRCSACHEEYKVLLDALHAMVEE